MQRDRRFEQRAGSTCGGGLLRVAAEAGAGQRADWCVNGGGITTEFAEIDQMLRDGYARGGDAKTQAINAIIRRYPQITRPMLWKRAQQLELAGSRSGLRRWNPAETRLLLDFINELPASVIAERLERPLKSVLGKARSLAMSSRLTTGLSVRQAAADLQVSHHTVVGLIDGGVLSVEEGRISEKSYRKHCQSLHPVTRQEAIPADVLADLVSDRAGDAVYEVLLSKTAVHLIASGGLSLREAAGLTVSDVYWLDATCARVQVRRGKLDDERTVILSNSAGRTLREYRARRPHAPSSDRLLVDEKGTPLSPQTLESGLLAFGRARGSPVRISARGLRHAFAFRFLERNCRAGSNDAFTVLPKLSNLMGHYSPETVLMYVGVLHPKAGGRQKTRQDNGEPEN